MISLVIPTYKERSNIEPLVERVGAALAQCGQEFELIIVDDDSPDGTPDEVRRLQQGRPWLRLLVRENERDLSTAVLAGWRIARGDILGCMDADLQHPPEMLTKLVARLEESGAEVVVGSRHVPGGGVSQWSLLRRFVSWTATLMATFILPGTLSTVRDPMSGFFLIRRKVLDRVALNPIGYKILLEVLAKGDYSRVEEVPFVFEEREKGGSKMSSKTVFYYLVHLLCLSLETGEAFRIFKYGFIGLTGALLNYLSTLHLFDARLGWPWPAAVIGGIAVAMVSNFIWNDLFTFWETRRSRPGLANTLRRFTAFVLLSSTGAALNFALYGLFYGLLSLPKGLALILAIILAGMFNFFVNANVTWRAWWHRRLLSRTLGLQAAPASAFAGTEMAEVPCNLCQSSRYKILYTGKPDNQGKVTAQTFRCTSEQHGDFTNIVQCADCGLLYENPRELERVIEEQYEAVEDPTYLRETRGRIYTFSKLLDSLARFTPDSGRLLDIGCYTGVFLDVARERGWQTFGVEPSTWAAGKARERGHTVINAPLRKAGLTEESFDVITIWDVIEHLHDPLGQLREAFRLLKPGGTLGLSTMNAGSLFAKITGRHWPWYMRMHFYYFTPGSITRMLKAAGFEVLQIERHKRIVSLRYLLEKAAASLGPLAIVGKVIGLPFGRIYVTVDFGDIMNVFARRPQPAEVSGHPAA